MVIYHQVTVGVTLPPGVQKEPIHFSSRMMPFVFLPAHRPALLLENYQPWLDLKVPSKVDASLSEVMYASYC